MNLKHLLTNLFKKEEKSESTEVISEVEIPEIPEPKEIKESRNPKPVLVSDKNWKLSEADKQILVAMLASGLSPSEVSDRAMNELNIKVNPVTIAHYAHATKWQPLIRKIRQETMSDLASVAGSHKKVRLERGERIYDKAISRGKLDVALKAVDHQRKEMEEQGPINLTLNQFNILSDEELQAKQREALEKIKRLSEKKGITLEHRDENRQIKS